jgi:hypothetical protein
MITITPLKAIHATILMLIATACAAPAVAQNWSPMEPPPRGRHSAVMNVYTDRMIVFGGFTTKRDRLGDVWVLVHPDGVGGPQAWKQLVPGNSTPVRAGHSAIYDAASNRMIVFGGELDSHFVGHSTSNDVWVLTHADGNGGTSLWTHLTPSGPAPLPRDFHSAVYDSANNRMIVFGGRSDYGFKIQSLNDVWVLSHANGLGGTPAWTQLHPTGSLPSRVYAHSAIYNEASNRMVVFGGALCPETDLYGCSMTNGLFVLSNANGDGPPYWTQLEATGVASPEIRSEHTAIYDPATNRMVVFGGNSGGGHRGTAVLDDTWVLSHADGTGGTPAWTRSTPAGTAPAPRSSHTAVYNAANNCMIVFGGLTEAAEGGGQFRHGMDDTSVLCDASN